MTARPWWSGLAPAQAVIACGGELHRLRWEDGALRALDHTDLEGERALQALGGEVCACADVAEAWARHDTDLRVLVLASRGPADPLRRQPQPGSPGAFPPGASPLIGRSGPWFGHPSPVGINTTAMTFVRPGHAPAGPPVDPLVAVMTLGGGLPDRLTATVAAYWTARLARGGVARDNRAALAAALHGRLTATVRDWLGEPGLALSTAMINGDERPELTRTGDQVDAAIPFGWLASVWAHGLATVRGRFALAALHDSGDRLTLLTVGSGLDDPRPLTLSLGPVAS